MQDEGKAARNGRNSSLEFSLPAADTPARQLSSCLLMLFQSPSNSPPPLPHVQDEGPVYQSCQCSVWRESVLQQLLESPQPVRETRTVLDVDREKVERIVSSSWC